MSYVLLPLDGHEIYTVIDALRELPPNEYHGTAPDEVSDRLRALLPLATADAQEFIRHLVQRGVGPQG